MSGCNPQAGAKEGQKQEQKHKYAVSRVSRRDRVNDITLALFLKR